MSIAVNDKTRARDLGIPFEGTPGHFNAITDVEGVWVGQVTLISGDGDLVVGKGPVRTGVTAVLPRRRTFDPVFAATYALNGSGEMTGTISIEESGFLDSPVMITNTHSVGAVHQAVIAWMDRNRYHRPSYEGFWAALPVVGETLDVFLNDVNGFHVKSEHVFEALDSASPGFVAEGNVGGGTGMRCHQFKGGIGTSSRVLPQEEGGYTVGTLVQANHGRRQNLTIAGVPVGQEITDLMPEINRKALPVDGNSIIVVVATDAPLLPTQLKRLARRVPIGIGRVGGMGEHTSGDIFVAFSTANPGISLSSEVMKLDMLPNTRLDGLFNAVVQSTEEAIINSLVAAETMTGINGNTLHALPHERTREILRRYNRLVEPEMWVEPAHFTMETRVNN